LAWELLVKFFRSDLERLVVQRPFEQLTTFKNSPETKIETADLKANKEAEGGFTCKLIFLMIIS
jgi:hypothetical protein